MKSNGLHGTIFLSAMLISGAILQAAHYGFGGFLITTVFVILFFGWIDK